MQENFTGQRSANSQWSRAPLTLFVGVVLALLAAACGDSPDAVPVADPAVQVADDQTPSPDPEPVADEPSKTGHEDEEPIGPEECGELLAHLKAEAFDRVGPWEFGPDPSTLVSSAEAGDAGGGGSARTNFSITNVQEAGVDEPDIVKSDGDHIYVLADNRLRVFAVDGSAAEEIHNVELEGAWGYSSILLAGQKVYAIGKGGTPLENRPEIPGRAYSDFVPTTVVSEIELSGSTTPKVRDLHIEGVIVSSRLVGEDLRLVLTSSTEKVGLARVLEYGRYDHDDAFREEATEANRAAIEDSEIGDWLPVATLDVDGETTSGLLSECDLVHRPSQFSGFDVLAVVSIDTSGPLVLPAKDTPAVLSDGGVVYANAESLYIAIYQGLDPQGSGTNNPSTEIHKFSTPASAAAVREGSASVSGAVLNQFSMSEHEGVLRVATTVPTATQTRTESMITMFEQRGGELVKIGEVGGMGIGERIYSVRFAGDLAYVVTFRLTDPLYTVDLSDPTAPVLLGELKITGYSGYLHPVGDGYVVGIGQEVDQVGIATGAKITLFDVTDLANPAAFASWVKPGSTSEGERDHHSVLWWSDESLLAVPVSPGEDGFFGAVVLRIVDGEMSEVGRVTHAVDYSDAESCRLMTAADEPKGADDDLARSLLSNRSGAVYQVCGPGQTVGVNGHPCQRMTRDDLGIYLGLQGELNLGEGEALARCQPDAVRNQIRRSLVIDSTLWTLSSETLQANDLATFEPINRYDFNAEE